MKKEHPHQSQIRGRCFLVDGELPTCDGHSSLNEDERAEAGKDQRASLEPVDNQGAAKREYKISCRHAEVETELDLSSLDTNCFEGGDEILACNTT